MAIDKQGYMQKTLRAGNREKFFENSNFHEKIEHFSNKQVDFLHNRWRWRSK
jgi:hypothetical protein